MFAAVHGRVVAHLAHSLICSMAQRSPPGFASICTRECKPAESDGPQGV